MTLHDKREGEGVYVGSDGERYVGAWLAGEREGLGTCEYVGGSLYVGEWLLSQGQTAAAALSRIDTKTKTAFTKFYNNKHAEKLAPGGRGGARLVLLDPRQHPRQSTLASD